MGHHSDRAETPANGPPEPTKLVYDSETAAEQARRRRITEINADLAGHALDVCLLCAGQATRAISYRKPEPGHLLPLVMVALCATCEAQPDATPRIAAVLLKAGLLKPKRPEPPR